MSYVKVNGEWKSLKSIKTRINGEWKSVKQVFVKENGDWKTIPISSNSVNNN